jgi:HD-GYP domain-containing protein (c-di-GMP phosphodiesterase class II)
VLEETMQLAGADAAALHLVDPKRRALQAAQVARSDASATSVQLAALSLTDAADAATAIVRAAVDGQTILVDVPRDDATVRQCLARDDGGQGTVALLSTPLRNRGGDVIGVLTLLSSTKLAAAVRPQVVAFIEKLSGVAAIAIETQRLLAEQKALLDAFIQLVAAAIDAKSPYTGGHCQRVPALAKMLAQAACDARDGPFRDFRLNDDEWEALHIASWLHDCGKVTTPEYVVDKATKLATIYDRIHEVRMRFEVLKRDAEIAFWKDRLAGGDEASLRHQLASQWRALDDDFAFIASCNEGGEGMDDAAVERVRAIAQRTWQRTLDDRIGISWEERARKALHAAPALPVTEPLLSDRPEHLIERQSAELMPDDNRWGFKLTVPKHRYNLGEVHNLTVRRGTLTAEERYKINDHIVQTIVMLENLPFPRHLAHVPEIAGGHHETMDGRGYPRRLLGGQMSALARMMAIADIFEALTATDRPYKKGKTLSESLQIMARMRDERHIDAELFDLFLASGVYRRYAEAYLPANQIDDVDVTLLRSGGVAVREPPVAA